MRVSARRADNEDSRILPLINIVFLLLIFFLVTGALTAADPFKTTPPYAVSGAEAGRNAAIILLGSSGQTALDGTIMEAAVLRDAIGARMAGDKPPAVHIKADANVSGVRLVGLLNLLREAGVERLKLLTVQEQE